MDGYLKISSYPCLFCFRRLNFKSIEEEMFAIDTLNSLKLRPVWISICCF